MANIKKSFNFRNGVQVDEDNLLVTSSGLVAIGKTVPTEALDVEGNLIVSGISSFFSVQSGVATISTLNPTEIIGAGVSIKSGVVTSTGGGGIVTFYGDGQYLQNLPSTQFVSSNTGIALTSQNCGIGTTNATSTFQVGGFPPSQMGVGISSVGNIHASGIISATSFVGSFDGNVTTATLADEAVKLQTARLVGGVSFDGTADINLPGVNVLGNQNTSGSASGLISIPNITVNTISATGNLNVNGNTDLDGNLDVDGLTNLDSLVVSEPATFGSTIQGISGENKIPSLYANMGSLPNASTYHGLFAHVHATGRGYFAHASNYYELVNKELDGRVGTGTEVYNVGSINSSGIITATSSLSVGTANPQNEIHVRKTGNAEIQVTSDTGIAGITVGRESSTSNVNNAEMRFGGGSGAPYSSAQSFDLINYGTGNFNYHLSGANSGNVQGDFYWHKGMSTRLMTLTNTGRLGIGETQPTTTLYVSGISTTTGASFVGGTLSVAGSGIIENNLTVNGNINVNGSLNGNLNGNFTGNLNGNVYANAGVSTFFRIGINTDAALDTVFGIDGTVDTIAGFYGLGVGTTNPDSAVDFRTAGSLNNRYIIPPSLTTADRNANITPAENGAFIYNSTTNKLEVYSGGSWTALEANSGGGEVNQNAFSNFAVSGQATVQADAKQDTVTFVAGTNVTITTDDSSDEITINASGGGGGGGSSLQSRTTDTATTSSLASGGASDLNMTTAKSYVLQKIQTNYAAWVTVYTDGTSRTNDASRAETTDPTPGSGVIAEVITSGSATQILTPGVIGWNNDSTPSTNTYVKVVNKESSAYPIQVTLHYLKLED
tara:strand:- start:2954 stop:5455 length:2502 start_codon:yes stop_codon:yes gene_type:complete